MLAALCALASRCGCVKLEAAGETVHGALAGEDDLVFGLELMRGFLEKSMRWPSVEAIFSMRKTKFTSGPWRFSSLMVGTLPSTVLP